MARVYAALASTAIDPSQYDISNSGLYTKQVYNLLNRKIGNTLYIKNMVFKDAALLKNPLKRRYQDLPNAQSTIGSPYIGERYNIYENLGRQIVFLDDVDGLTGFTFKNGFETIQNTSVIANMEEVAKGNAILFSNYGEGDSVYNVSAELNKIKFLDEELTDKVLYKPHRDLRGYSIDSPLILRGEFGETREVKDSRNIYSWYNENGGIKSTENNTLEFDSVYSIDASEINTRSLLYRTNQLFSQGKIHSLVSRMANEKGGVTRGRNLKNAKGQYSRVWTINNQYTKLKQTIRPKDEDGNIIGLADYQNQKLNITSFRPFNGASRLEKMGTMMPNGMPKIAPTTKEDIKKCMFSIENLAWKDVLTADNKNVLKDGQKGPNGGRVMWFPPYNLKFSENVSVNWEGSDFIGRGEKIYTYNNTDRGGQLEFTILVDHPSAIDKWGRYADENVKENEEQLLRFFSGEDNLISYIANSKNNVQEETASPSTDAQPTKEPFTIKYWLFFPWGLSGYDWMTRPSELLQYLWGGKGSGAGYEKGNGVHLVSALSDELKKKGWKYETDLSNINVTDVSKEDTASYGFNNTDDFYNKIINTGSTLLRESVECSELSKNEIQDTIFSFEDLINGDLYSKINLSGYSEDYDVKIKVKGYDDVSQTTADDRGRFIYRWLLKQQLTDAENISYEKGELLDTGFADKVNSEESKLARRVCVEVDFIPKAEIKPNIGGEDAFEEIFAQAQEETNRAVEEALASISNIIPVVDVENGENEYNYFKDLTTEDPIVIKNIVKKVKYFSPAFHSITPEGYNSRLTFLHQCTRQGPTNIGDSTKAGNLAFGRPPVCVLRIGDFYNTKIIIESMSITYESDGGIQWDMNQEGIGLQPMLANISIGFKFLGGSDLGGPIARLQNAVSENFFANTSVYSERADYRESDSTKTKVINITEANPTHQEYEL